MQLQSSCPRQADPRFRSAPRFPCETTHALQQHQNRPYKILILQELVLIILEFVDACPNEIIRFIGAGRHLIPSNINRFFAVSQNHHILWMVSEPFVVGGQNEILVLLIQRTILHVIDFACGRQSQLTSEILLDFLIDVALPGSIGAMNRYGAQNPTPRATRFRHAARNGGNPTKPTKKAARRAARWWVI